MWNGSGAARWSTLTRRVGGRTDTTATCVSPGPITFSTPDLCYFLRRGRDKAVVGQALGDEFAGVLVRDFYAAGWPKRVCDKWLQAGWRRLSIRWIMAM